MPAIPPSTQRIFAARGSMHWTPAAISRWRCSPIAPPLFRRVHPLTPPFSTIARHFTASGPRRSATTEGRSLRMLAAAAAGLVGVISTSFSLLTTIRTTAKHTVPSGAAAPTLEQVEPSDTVLSSRRNSNLSDESDYVVVEGFHRVSPNMRQHWPVRGGSHNFPEISRSAWAEQASDSTLFRINDVQLEFCQHAAPQTKE